MEIGVYETLEAAKAAGQANYENCVYPALNLSKVEALMQALQDMNALFSEDGLLRIGGSYRYEKGGGDT